MLIVLWQISHHMTLTHKTYSPCQKPYHKKTPKIQFIYHVTDHIMGCNSPCHKSRHTYDMVNEFHLFIPFGVKTWYVTQLVTDD